MCILFHGYLGRTCLPWSDFPPDDGDVFVFTDVSLAAAENYCRNPDNSDALWCYVGQDGEREQCQIPTGGIGSCFKIY